jgi:hypothetical protein
MGPPLARIRAHLAYGHWHRSSTAPTRRAALPRAVGRSKDKTGRKAVGREKRNPRYPASSQDVPSLASTPSNSQLELNEGGTVVTSEY